MSKVLNTGPLRQRSDYTFRFNTRTGRHGWLRLTPAYSLKIVEGLIDTHAPMQRILDPFCGTGTTALIAAYHGYSSETVDINPFLVWFAQSKIEHYTTNDLEAVNNACALSLDLVMRGAIDPLPAPGIHNIERWWRHEALEFLCLLKAAILTTTADCSAERTLLMVAFCRSVIQLSNAAFNHQSMSFKNDTQLCLGFDTDMTDMFAEDVQFVLQGAADNPSGYGRVTLGDSRDLTSAVEGQFDLVVTSPPYANRMSYIRELRPYMYWLGFLENGRHAGELDWAAIGGTWGIATSRLTDWRRPIGHFDSPHLDEALNKIAHANQKNGVILANYVAKYFDDMWNHFQGLPAVLAEGADVHYIVGNSTFYGTLVSTELIFAEMLKVLEFDGVKCHPIRKRNSKKELIEFDVTAKWRHG